MNRQKFLTTYHKLPELLLSNKKSEKPSTFKGESMINQGNGKMNIKRASPVLSPEVIAGGSSGFCSHESTLRIRGLG